MKKLKSSGVEQIKKMKKCRRDLSRRSRRGQSEVSPN